MLVKGEAIVCVKSLNVEIKVEKESLELEGTQWVYINLGGERYERFSDTQLNY